MVVPCLPGHFGPMAAMTALIAQSTNGSHITLVVESGQAPGVGVGELAIRALRNCCPRNFQNHLGQSGQHNSCMS